MITWAWHEYKMPLRLGWDESYVEEFKVEYAAQKEREEEAKRQKEATEKQKKINDLQRQLDRLLQ